MYDSAKSELLKFGSKLGLKIVILIGTFSQNVLITVLIWTEVHSLQYFHRYFILDLYKFCFECLCCVTSTNEQKKPIKSVVNSSR